MNRYGHGAVYAIAAYGMWGIAPIYFFWVEFATPLEIVAHRVVWSLCLLLLITRFISGWSTLRGLRPRQVGWLFVSSVLIAVNWLVFVWGLQADRMLEASLGYYINPLVSIMLGLVFLGERLRLGQSIAVGLAALGVLNEVVSVGVIPWFGLTLAVTFGLYGLVRKIVGVGAVTGLTIETALILPLALGYLIYGATQGVGTLSTGNTPELALLALGGLVTMAPLLCFTAAAIRMPLTTLGFFQYLAPTITFFLAIYGFNEPLRSGQLLSFACIWTGLLVFSLDSRMAYAERPQTL